MKRILAVLLLTLSLWAQTSVTVTGNVQLGSAVKLQWTASAGATSYNIYRSETNGGPYVFGRNVAATTAYDTSVQHGHTYYYVVRAYDGNQESGNSNQATAVIP